jgi:zinc transport system substrate-binding protein
MLLLHSYHNIAKQDFEKGTTYLDLMKQNVANLKTGLSE